MIKKYKRIDGLAKPLGYPLEIEAVFYTGDNVKEIEEFSNTYYSRDIQTIRKMKPFLPLPFTRGNGFHLFADTYVFKNACPDALRIYTMRPEEFELLYELES